MFAMTATLLCLGLSEKFLQHYDRPTCDQSSRGPYFSFTTTVWTVCFTIAAVALLITTVMIVCVIRSSFAS